MGSKLLHIYMLFSWNETKLWYTMFSGARSIGKGDWEATNLVSAAAKATTAAIF